MAGRRSVWQKRKTCDRAFPMDPEQFAKLIAASIAQHQSRGLIDDGFGMLDVVIHGRVDLLAVAQDVLSASAQDTRPAGRSWSPWFTDNVAARRSTERQKRVRAKLVDQIECGSTPAEAAIARLRLRELDL